MNKNIFGFLLAFISITLSCGKLGLDHTAQDQEAFVSLSVSGFDYISENELKASTNNPKDESENEQFHIQYNDNDFIIESQLTTISENKKNSLNKNAKHELTSNVKELKNNVKYKMLVYNSNNRLVNSKDFVYGNTNADKDTMKLQVNTDYTFVVVSAGSTTNLPNIESIQDLNSAKINNVNSELLYWKEKTRLNRGRNMLAAVLRPQYSEVTVTLQMDQTMTGSITKISNTVLSPITENLSLRLSDGTVSYGSTREQNRQIVFSNIGNNGVRTITSEPLNYIHNELTTSKLNFGELIVDGETKQNINITGLKFKPGYRYNLILTLKTCTEDVSGKGFNWEFPQTSKTFKEKYVENKKEKERDVTYDGINFKPQGSNTTTFVKNGEIITFNFTEAGADYGFVYDITELDNAFNLEVNGTPIVGTDVTTGEIQFQNNATNTTQNIEFQDGSQYQSDKVPSIWTLIGTKAKPIIRVVIGRNGDVLLYGSKSSGGELFPLRLKNGLQFNRITWNGGNKTNNIIATSRVEGKTVMKASGSGKRKISCAQ